MTSTVHPRDSLREETVGPGEQCGGEGLAQDFSIQTEKGD